MSDFPRKPDDPHAVPGGLEELFREARDELARAPSVLPAVERRIAGAPVWPGVSARRWSLAAVVLLGIGVVAALAVSRARQPGSPAESGRLRADGSGGGGRAAQFPPGAGGGPGFELGEASRLEVGGAVLVEHASCLIGPSTVAVVWSRGEGGTAGDEGAPVGVRTRHGKYEERVLARREVPGGRTIVCSLYVADPGTRPALEPPIVRTRTDAGGVLAFGTSPGRASAEDLARVLASSGLDGDAVLREVRAGAGE